jgi:hypothetical protein
MGLSFSLLTGFWEECFQGFSHIRLIIRKSEKYYIRSNIRYLTTVQGPSCIHQVPCSMSLPTLLC